MYLNTYACTYEYTYIFIYSALVVPDNLAFRNSQKSPTTEFT